MRYWFAMIALVEILSLAVLWPPPNGWRVELQSYAHLPSFSLQRQAEQREQARLLGEQLKQQQQHCTSLPGDTLHCE